MALFSTKNANSIKEEYSLLKTFWNNNKKILSYIIIPIISKTKIIIFLQLLIKFRLINTIKRSNRNDYINEIITIFYYNVKFDSKNTFTNI